MPKSILPVPLQISTLNLLVKSHPIPALLRNNNFLRFRQDLPGFVHLIVGSLEDVSCILNAENLNKFNRLLLRIYYYEFTK